MADWFARPLAERPEGEFFTAYAWADHTGWHFAPEPPERVVPTGHIWAWGGNDWAAWREETDRCAGLWLRRAGVMPIGDDWEKADVVELEPQGEPPLPSLHRDTRFFRSDDGDANWHGLPVRILRVIAPARVDLFDCPAAVG